MHAEGGRDRGRGRQVKKRTYLVLAKNGAEEGGPPLPVAQPDADDAGGREE